MDSADESTLAKTSEEDDVEIELYPHDKNETDLELAIQRAMDLNPKQIIMIAALGGRLDQTVANITLLSDIRLSDV